MPMGHSSFPCWMYPSFFISCVSPGTDDCFVENKLFVVPTDSVDRDHSSITPSEAECKQKCEEAPANCTVSYELLYHFKISIGK